MPCLKKLMLTPPGELLGFERNKGTKEKISLFSLGKQKTLTQRVIVPTQ
jgi:hypothetical protein